MVTFLFIDQMANIGSEVERTIAWRKKEMIKKVYRLFLEL